MSTRMLIDARHSEETRVTIVKGNRVEDFDYESSTRRQLKGNIYLARVTRVEPSLQAAFVEYGGNRHGFLAFSEIHPDYYQIPAEDREELVAAEMAAVREVTSKEQDAPGKDAADGEAPADETDHSPEDDDETPSSEDDNDTDQADDGTEDETNDDAELESDAEEERDSEVEEAAARRRALKALKRRYNIQEVIKKRQVLLIQVVKEERGNKGAALTTYLSLAGRYCVLMPNSTHAGGISRKISNVSDRKKLKTIISGLDVDEEMGLIIRTAGMRRTKLEIKRDYEYLLRLWNEIRELTLKSVAPTLVYEEANLIKRTIRDLYTRDIDEVLVEGERGYRAAKDFMKLLMPSHSKKVQNYKDHIPLFHRYQVESHLEAMYQPVVQLKSGGYIVINPTEALISIDVNSGRSTREHNVEETAVKTNLEAAEEVARQLKLRDMAGLIVIDFIDMEERSNNRAVERRMKEVLKSDRARIQVGRISSFGLMEMSRQRMRPNLLEASMETCQTCSGTGVVRSIESAALTALRNLEEEGIRARSSTVRVSVCPEVAVYLLNKKRAIIAELETRYGFYVEILAKTNLGPSDLEIEREAGTVTRQNTPESDSAVSMGQIESKDAEEEKSADRTSDDTDDEKPQRKRRRRRRRRKSDQTASSDNNTAADNDGDSDNADGGDQAANDEEQSGDDNRQRTRRRRGRRGGRGRRPETTPETQTETSVETPDPDGEKHSGAASGNAEDDGATSDTAVPSDTGEQAGATSETAEEKPRRRRRRVKKTEDGENSGADSDAAPKPEATQAPDAATEEKPARKPRRKTAKSAEDTGEKTDTDTDTNSDEKPKRRRRTAAKKADAGEPSDNDTDAGSNDAGKADEADAKPARRKRSPRKAASDNASKPEDGDAATAADAPAPKAENAETKGSESTDADQPKRKGWWQRTFG